jgi:Rieske Fe-S protein
LSWVLTLPFAILAGHSINRHFSIAGKKELRISSNLNNGITFLDKVIIVKKENDLLFFSSRCPHLGCQINSMENNQLVCPCHGSRFDSNGRNLKGPANESLKKLEYTEDGLSKEIIISL